MSDPIEVLEFWLDEVGPEGWYSGGEALDALCRTRFLDIWQAAMDGGIDHWAEGCAGTLAYLIVTDQLGRNMHRGTALAFATDPLARAAARRAVANSWDLDAPEPDRQFFYMPFEHAEDPADQALAVTYMTERMSSAPDLALHAKAHQDIIARFGRFPGRNGALGRQTTAEEAAFLSEGGYGAIIRRLKGSHASSA